MPPLDWSSFDSLPGSRNHNFETLCRGLIRLHFGKYGQFAALKNQPGVEFHLKLSSDCSELGGPPRWYGWQCKFHQRTSTGDLNAASRTDIKDSLAKAEKYLPGLTDWVLWTPYTLSKPDQEWFKKLPTRLTLHQWAEDEIDTYLNGPGLMLRSTYFGDLVITPENLEQQHREAIQPIKERWIEPVHQSVEAERSIRQMLGEPGSWTQMLSVGKSLKKTAEVVNALDKLPDAFKQCVPSFVAACSVFADTLLHFHEILSEGDLDLIQQKLNERKKLIDACVISVPRRLRALNLPAAIDATNALDDMGIAQGLLDEAEEYLAVGLVAVLADAGGGKTQMSAQLTARQNGRPAGILLHGLDLHKGQMLDDLAHHFKINGSPVNSMERLLSALDAAGKRGKCRLPIVIDGLNEAENPKDWKPLLAILNETIKRYPNVLVVCTLRTGERRRDDPTGAGQTQTNARESFAVMALPDGIRQIKSEGFGGDVQEAIKKYFSHYKINSEGAELPLEFLKHPLTLRIFCEVTNPKKEFEVKVDYFPAALSPLFGKYVANACERISQMPNLSYAYTLAEMETAIYRLGLALWNSRKREISEAAYKDAISDTAIKWDKWDSNIINLLAQEGIVFRNPGPEPGQYAITPVYDALGGYIIANSLLTKYVSDRTFAWLKEPQVIELFAGENSHELAADIFRSLVALTPRKMHGLQLWKEVPEVFRNAAIRFAVEIDANYLDKETISALFELLRDNPKERQRLLYQLQELRAAPNHPLNVEFLDTALRAMSIAVRDLSWTEWIRSNRTERFNDLISIESNWKADLLTRLPSDRLRAIWVMWLLTSTDHALRDIATRAIYWFGRGNPAALFEESIRSLEINDIYVPERMIAASYGVATALHAKFTDDKSSNSIFREYARRLYDLIFKEGSPFATTHILLRHYAAKTIQLAVIRKPDMFSDDELKRTNPPFDSGVLREWGESPISKEELHGLDSPFRMDFENYTLGRLTPGRRNYDYDHEEYKKIRARILWRVQQIGWTKELFNKVDRSIEQEYRGPRTGNDGKKTDRYGKKYSWIAYYEMSGLLQDQGLLKESLEPSLLVDIDPSFPEPVTERKLIQGDYLGDPAMMARDWIVHGSPPDLTPYYRVDRINDQEGPWILLDGYFTQEDERRGRQLFCFIRSFLIYNHDADAFLHHLSKQDMGGRWLPEKPSVAYTLSGEIPWSKAFPENGETELSFVIKEEIVKVKKPQQEYYLDGEKLALKQTDLIHIRVFGLDVKDGEKNVGIKDLDRIETCEVMAEVEELKQEYAKFTSMIPVCDISFEGQALDGDARRATTLAKEIATDLELKGQPQTFDLFTKEGVGATFNISDHSEDHNNTQTMFFIKENLLKAYLTKRQQTLIWAIWGEREYSSDQIEKIYHQHDPSAEPYAAVFSFVKRYE